MRCFAQIKDANGNILVRWEDEVRAEGDLSRLVTATIDLFRHEFPNTSLLTEDGLRPLTVEWGNA